MEREYVGIDVHRRRSVVRVSAGGERLSVVQVDNDPVALAAVVPTLAQASVLDGERGAERRLSSVTRSGAR